MSEKLVHGLFDDDDILMSCVKTVRHKKYEINDVYSPFPIHGLDKAMGLKPTRIAYTSFIYGVVGLLFASWLTWFTMIEDWPQNIGGKPSFTWLGNLPAFIPILFELTVFFAAHLMVWTYFYKNKLYPGKKGGSPDPRTTDDKFLIEFILNDDTSDLETILKEAGAIEVSSKEVVEEKKAPWFKLPPVASVIILLFSISSCSFSDEPQRDPNSVFFPNMYYSIAYEPYSEIQNGLSNMEARTPVDGTIKRGYVPYGVSDTNEGYVFALDSLKSPVVFNLKTEKEGKELYNIYCISCHGISGDGQGKMVKNEKFLGVPTFSSSRLPNITEGSIFHVITYGRNMMGSHASQLTSQERWVVSQHVLKLRNQLK